MSTNNSNWKETAYDYIDGNSYATFYTGQRKWLNKINNEWLVKYPDQVKVIQVNEDGSMLVHIPKNWLKLSPPKKMNLTDEQRRKIGDRLNKHKEMDV